MQTIELNKKVASIEVADDKIIINLEQKYVPKDGEYFYVYVKSTIKAKFIGIKKEGKYITSRYCSYDIKFSTINNDEGWICNNDHIKEIRPATKEEKYLLDKALEKRGEKWNPETKQIEELPKVGDFCIFWDCNKSDAKCGILKKTNSTCEYPYMISYGSHFRNCTLFQSVEHFKEFIKK